MSFSLALPLFSHTTNLMTTAAVSRQWQSIGGLWAKTIQEYKFLVRDAMNSDAPIAALASAKFLLDLNSEEAAKELCNMIGQGSKKPNADYPARNHSLFSCMPPDVLYKVLNQSTPHLFHAKNVDRTIFRKGDKSKSCFFPVFGTFGIKIPGLDQLFIPTDIIGEFSLWIPNIPRTGTLEVLDDGLLLEIHNEELLRAVEGRSDIEEVIYGIIKGRLIENIVQSNIFFPGTDHPGKLLEEVAVCKKYSPGDKLDIESLTHIIFVGKVEIMPQDNLHLSISAEGGFDSMAVVGIVSDLEPPDRNIAIVQEETVTVSIPHEDLRNLQLQNIRVKRAWNGLCGERLGEISSIKKEFVS